jgi:urease subunit beta
MIPGEYLLDGPPIELNAGWPTAVVEVKNTGDRPIPIGSHYHFFETNRALVFDRERAYGMRLDLPAGTAARFEPGEVRRVQLVALGGQRRVYGNNALVMGDLDDPKIRQQSLKRMRDGKFGNTSSGITAVGNTASGSAAPTAAAPASRPAKASRKVAKKPTRKTRKK